MTDDAVCQLSDIADGGARGFVTRVGDKQRNVVAARKGERVYIYINLCPHSGHLLDIVPDRFFGPDAPEHLRCGVHGALFQIEDGYCTSGPCDGDSLQSVPAEVRDGMVYVITSDAD